MNEDVKTALLLAMVVALILLGSGLILLVTGQIF